MKDHSESLPAISVIMAVYNQRDYVSAAVESVVNQSFNDWELIICDDGSSDGSSEILRSYENMYPQKIKVLRNQRNLGVSRARNMALSGSRGKIIAFLDSDDWWEKDKLDKQLTLLKGSPDAGFVFTMVNVIKDGNISEQERIIVEGNFNKLCALPKLIRRYLLKQDNICFSSLMAKREAIEAAGFFDEELSYQVEDWLLLLKMSCLFGFACVGQKLTNYRLHPNSYTARVFLRGTFAEGGVLQIFNKTWTFALKRLFRKGNLAVHEKLGFLFMLCLYRFKIIFRILIKKLPSKIKHKSGIKMFIFFVTSKCNSKCNTCFYWGNLNNGNELDATQIEKIFNTLPRTQCLLITGGEPFLRDDLEKILLLAAKQKNILSVAINTNGTCPDVIYKVMHNTVSARRDAKQYHLNVSLDGFSQTHNKIRGIPCYDSAVSSLEKAVQLGRRFNGFNASVVTVISKENAGEVLDFAEYIYKNMDLYFHYFEIIRGEPKTAGSLSLDEAEVKNIYEGIISLQEKYFRKQGLLNVGAAAGRLRHMYKLQYDNFFKNKRWDISCLAGRNTFVVYEDGRLSPCELREPALEIRDFDFNIKKSLNSKKFKGAINSIRQDRCACTHGCFIGSSL